MLSNYLKIARRVLLKNKVFFFTNVFGLAVSMSVCLLIMLFIMGQRNLDTFHVHADRTYRVYSDYKATSNASSQLYATGPFTLGDILIEEYPVVEEAVLIQRFRTSASSEQTNARLSGYATDASFFRVFDFTLASGNPKTALSSPDNLILSHEAATRFFGDEPAMGKTLTIDDEPFTVTGILEAPEGTTHFDLEALMSIEYRRNSEAFQWMRESWHGGVTQSYHYLLLEEGVQPSTLSDQFPAIIDAYYPGNEKAWLEGMYLQPLTAINLGKQMGNQLSDVIPGGVAWFLGLLGGIVMLAACFNFINLSLARSLTRAREVGMRKVSGARRSQIVGQFLSEAVLVSLVALCAAIIGLIWLIPMFNSMQGLQSIGGAITWASVDMAKVVLLFTGFSILIGIGAGVYPALHLSRFMPSSVLKGSGIQAGTARMFFRKSLVVLQVTVSLIFLFTSIVIYNQFRLAVGADYGFEPSNVINVRLYDVPYDVFRQEAERIAGVEGVSGLSLLPMSGTRSDVWIQTETTGQPEKCYRLSMDYDALDNLGITVLAGRNISPAFPADSSQSVLLNERAVRTLNLGSAEQAIGQFLTLYDDWRVQVVGVVKDFQTDPTLTSIDPLVLDYAPHRLNYANIRARSENTEPLLLQLQDVWATTQSMHPLEHEMYDALIMHSTSMQSFRDFLGIIGFVAGIAITIACLGLFGIAIYSVERRTKEVGIRKVLGADIERMILLLSSDFLRLMGLALLLSVPVAWIINFAWLQSYEIRTSLGPSVFLLGTGIMATLLLLMVGTQTLQASLKNPVDTLRYD